MNAGLQHRVQRKGIATNDSVTEIDTGTRRPVISGCIDFYGYGSAAGGWFIGGWVGSAWRENDAAPHASIRFQQETSVADVTLCLHPRLDVRAIGFGFLLFLPSARPELNQVAEARLDDGLNRCTLLATDTTAYVPEREAIERARLALATAPRSERRDRLLNLLGRVPYQGADTLEALPWPCFLELDATYFCPPASLALKGWFADPFDQVQAVRLRSGSDSCDIAFDGAVAIARPDVIDVLGPKHGLTQLRCGFVVLAEAIFAPGRPLYLEIEARNGQAAFRHVPPPRSSGLAAARDLLASFDLRYAELARAYDRVIGPAVGAMNEFHLGQPPTCATLSFGEQRLPVRASLVIRLGSLLDDMESQLAAFARTLAPDHELIYVLDDPAALRATQSLAASAFARFGRPFTLLALSHAVGAAPARNAGLRQARGRHACFLHADVFPDTADWLEAMLRTLEADPGIGAVGAMLLFEDGTVQHAGSTLAPQAEHGGWALPNHPGRGRTPPPGEAAVVEGLSGACMMLPRALAMKLGGFDEGFVLEGFEDIDLCRRVQEAGYACVVEGRARLHHLERRTPSGGQHHWGRNLRSFNAWRYAGKWANVGGRR